MNKWLIFLQMHVRLGKTDVCNPSDTPAINENLSGIANSQIISKNSISLKREITPYNSG